MVAAPPMLIHPGAVDSCGLRGFSRPDAQPPAVPPPGPLGMKKERRSPRRPFPVKICENSCPPSRRPCPLSLDIPGFSHVLPSCPALSRLSQLSCLFTPCVACGVGASGAAAIWEGRKCRLGAHTRPRAATRAAPTQKRGAPGSRETARPAGEKAVAPQAQGVFCGGTSSCPSRRARSVTTQKRGAVVSRGTVSRAGRKTGRPKPGGISGGAGNSDRVANRQSVTESAEPS